jgi:hypothetical protein
MKVVRLRSNIDNNDVSVVDLFTTDPCDSSTPMKVPAGTPDPLAWLRDMYAAFKCTLPSRRIGKLLTNSLSKYLSECFREQDLPATALISLTFGTERCTSTLTEQTEMETRSKTTPSA